MIVILLDNIKRNLIPPLSSSIYVNEKCCENIICSWGKVGKAGWTSKMTVLSPKNDRWNE